MSTSFKLELVTPTSYVVLENVISVSATSESGKFTALANHERLMVNLMPCIVNITINGNIYKKYFIDEGIIKIRPEIYCLMAEEIVNIDEVGKEFIRNHPKISKILNILEEN